MEQRHRIFIAINLPEEIRTALVDYQRKWPDLPTRWIKSENLHITLVFVGDVKEEWVSEIRNVIRKVTAQHKTFFINLTRIFYGPPKAMPPRMIWVSGDLPEEFANLKEDLEKELSGKIRLVPEKRETSLHITLARIKEWEWRRIEPEERPEIEEFIDLNFQVFSIEVMESVLKRSGAEYKILESYKLKKD